jgi:hypothetical protein
MTCLSRDGLSQVEVWWQGGQAVTACFTDLDADSTLAVVLVGKQTAIFGNWEEKNDRWCFTPLVPFTEGLQYGIVRKGVMIDTLVIEGHTGGRTWVVGTYPSTDTVPENLLKMHFLFSAPMGEQHSKRFITVANADGDTLSQTFLPLRPELWNASHDQLTLWLDPGRIKRGLGPNLWLGQPLNRGQTYHLTVSAEWKDRQGRALDTDYRRTFTAGDADRQKPDPSEWQLAIPGAGTKDPLHIRFNEVMDFSLATDCISVWQDQELVPGNIRLGKGEASAAFYPVNDWTEGSFQISVETRLEDLAGNNLNRLFDENVGDVDNNSLVEDQVVKMEFEIER